MLCPPTLLPTPGFSGLPTALQREQQKHSRGRMIDERTNFWTGLNPNTIICAPGICLQLRRRRRQPRTTMNDFAKNHEIFYLKLIHFEIIPLSFLPQLITS
jgi:hypothetical protein